MKFDQVVNIWWRVCDSACDCLLCPLRPFFDSGCIKYAAKNPEKFQDMLLAWEQKHPTPTMASDFLSRNPKAEKREDGTPVVCARACGYDEPSYCKAPSTEACYDCWHRSMKGKR